MPNKNLLLLSNVGLSAYQWQGGRLSDESFFPDSAEGRQHFARYLQTAPKAPYFLIADVVEEDFHVTTLPHVIGRSGSELVQRKLQQFFRATPFRQANRQGRQKEGRKDDQFLFSALTASELLNSWLKFLEAERLPLAAIYSMASVSEAMVKQLSIKGDNLLLVTWQRHSGIRQSYFQAAGLKFSRLTLLPEANANALPELLTEEIGKTQQYLSSLRLLAREAALNVVVLCPVDECHLVNKVPELEQVKLSALSLPQAAQQLGLKEPVNEPYADRLLLEWVAKRAIPNHYAPVERRHYYLAWRFNRVLLQLSILLIAVAMLGASVNFSKAITYNEQVAEQTQRARQLELQTQQLASRLPAIGVSHLSMKEAVATYLDLKHATVESTPAQKVSQALEQVPAIELERLVWAVSADPNTRLDQLNQPPSPPDIANTGAVPANNEAAPSQANYLMVWIAGRVNPVKHNYRFALDQVGQLSQAFKLGGGQVYPVKLPLDIRSAGNITSQTSTEQSDTAEFVLKVIYPEPR